jgi:hypothetical protein
MDRVGRPRKIHVFAIQSIQTLAEILPHRTRYFTLLLAWDAPPKIDKDELADLFRPLVLERGLAYFCAWGSRCEMVHDAVDVSAVEREARRDPLDYVTMTTRHANESLGDAVWFFRHLALPSEPHVFADFSRFAVSVGNAEWDAVIKQGISSSKSKPAWR